MASIINYEFAILLLFLFIDLVFIIKPKLGLLNILVGLFSIVFTVLNIQTLPFTGQFLSFVVTFMVIISILTIVSGINLYTKKGSN